MSEFCENMQQVNSKQVPNRSKVTGKAQRSNRLIPQKKEDQQQMTVVLQEGDRIREENK